MQFRKKILKMKHTDKMHFTQTYGLEVYEDKMHAESRNLEVRNMILSRTLDEEECDSRNAQKCLSPLKIQLTEETLHQIE